MKAAVVFALLGAGSLVSGQHVQCSRNQTVTEPATCASVAKQNNIPLDLFAKLNPYLKHDCSALKSHTQACVDGKIVGDSKANERLKYFQAMKNHKRHAAFHGRGLQEQVHSAFGDKADKWHSAMASDRAKASKFFHDHFTAGGSATATSTSSASPSTASQAAAATTQAPATTQTSEKPPETTSSSSSSSSEPQATAASQSAAGIKYTGSTKESSSVSSFLGKNSGIGSWYMTNQNSDSTNGHSWCGYPYTNEVPGFAPDVSKMLSDFNGDYEAAAKAYCGLEALVKAEDGTTALLYLSDGFDSRWVRTPGSIDIISAAWAQLSGKAATNKNDVVNVDWQFTGRRAADFAYGGGGWS